MKRMASTKSSQTFHLFVKINSNVLKLDICSKITKWFLFTQDQRLSDLKNLITKKDLINVNKKFEDKLSKEENIVKNERFLIYLHQGKYVNENQLLSLLQDPKDRKMLHIQVQIRPLFNR